jgi:hypothetical protein
MRKIFCDACGEEILKGRVHTLSYLCHLDKAYRGSCGYVEGKVDKISGKTQFDSISGREVSYEICTRCYNRVMSKAVEALEKLQSEHGLDNLTT